jgi:hypothetical protein
MPENMRTPFYCLNEKDILIRKMLGPVWGHISDHEYYNDKDQYGNCDFDAYVKQSGEMIIIGLYLSDQSIFVFIHPEGDNETGREYDLSDPSSIDRMINELLDWFEKAKFAKLDKNGWKLFCKIWNYPDGQDS